MKSIKSFILLCTIMILISACGQTANTQTSHTLPPPTATFPPPTPTLAPFHLSEPGPFKVGRLTVKINDDSRGKHLVSITFWYPAIHPANSTKHVVVDAAPDPSAAPYPLILSSTKVADIFAPILVSHGFTWASIDYIDSYARMGVDMINQPQDILFALGMVATNPPENLVGIIDSDHAGVIGYSFDGYNSLALSGARLDQQYYLSQCPTPDAITSPFVIKNPMSSFSCDPAEDWDGFLARIKKPVPIGDDGLWQPITDPRIRAVMPMAPEGWWLFGEKGLAFTDRPVLMIGSTNDELYREDTMIFDHLGTTDKSLITFVGQDHMMIYDSAMIARMAHFAVAFFGNHLQGRTDLAYYYSQEYVNNQPDLAWGPVLDN